MARSTLPFSQPLATIAGARKEAVFAGKGEKARKKADQAAIVFGDGSGQIVIGDLARDATQRGERVHVTADEGLEALAVSELQIQHAAVRFDQGEGIELALVAGVIERAEVPPIDFEALAGGGSMRTKARLGFSCGRTVCTYSRRMVWPPLIAEWPQPLLDDGGRDAWDPFPAIRRWWL